MQAKDIQVAFHLAFGRDERGVATFANAQAIDVVGHLAVQKTDAVGAGQAQPAAGAKVQNARRLAERGMFRRYIAIITDDFRTVQFSEVRAKVLVKFTQNQFHESHCSGGMWPTHL